MGCCGSGCPGCPVFEEYQKKRKAKKEGEGSGSKDDI